MCSDVLFAIGARRTAYPLAPELPGIYREACKPRFLAQAAAATPRRGETR